MSDPFFDSNIVIDWLNDSQAATNELARYPRHRISRIVWTEILAGEPLESRDHIQQLIAPFEIVELDARIALAAADIRYRKLGLLIIDHGSRNGTYVDGKRVAECVIRGPCELRLGAVTLYFQPLRASTQESIGTLGLIDVEHDTKRSAKSD